MFTKKYFIADIGATNARLALIDSNRRPLKKSYYKTAEMDIYATIKEFASKDRIDAACIAVAGILDSDRTHASFTNLQKDIGAAELKEVLRTKNVILLNDFEALGLGIDGIRKEQYEELTSKDIDTKGIIAVAGAGTGLGISILYEYEGRHYPIPSEGGHSSIIFDLESRLEKDLYLYLKKKKIPMEAESIISGRGLLSLYDFLLAKKIKHNEKIRKEIGKSRNPVLITRYALQDKDPLCVKASELLVMFYARVCRQLALFSLCSTLVISGPIMNSLRPILQEMFLETFIQHSHTEARKMLESMSVIILTEPELALAGCFRALKS